MKYHFVPFLVFLFLLNCSGNERKPTEPITNAYTGAIDQPHLIKAMNAAGGLETWQQWNKVSFSKHTQLFDSAGVVEMDVHQKVVWTRNPQRVLISWVDDTNSKHEIRFEEGHLQKLENDRTVSTADQQRLMNTVLSATYVMSIPFKLWEDEYRLLYKGVDTLFNGAEVHVLEAEFTPTELQNESSDIWQHYYQRENYRQLGYQVHHLDHISLVENTEMENVGGIVWPTKRSSWRMDEAGNKLFLRAAYTYSDYSVH